MTCGSTTPYYDNALKRCVPGEEPPTGQDCIRKYINCLQRTEINSKSSKGTFNEKCIHLVNVFNKVIKMMISKMTSALKHLFVNVNKSAVFCEFVNIINDY